MEADGQMSNQDILDDLAKPLTWRHRFVQWLAGLLGVRLYACPVIVLVTNRLESQDGPRVH